MNELVRFLVKGTTGMMPLKDVPNELQICRKRAEDVLKNGFADHVVYASEEYASNGNDVIEVRFYEPPIELSDKEFEKRVSAMPEFVIYALHRRKKEIM